MSLTPCGAPASRTFRVLRAEEGLGLTCTLKPCCRVGPGIRTDDNLAIDPNATIRAIVRRAQKVA